MHSPGLTATSAPGKHQRYTIPGVAVIAGLLLAIIGAVSMAYFAAF